MKPSNWGYALAALAIIVAVGKEHFGIDGQYQATVALASFCAALICEAIEGTRT